MSTNENLEQYLHMFSHELRGPLTAATGSIQLFTENHPELSEDKYIRGLQNDLKYMGELVSDFTRFFSKRKCQKTLINMDAFLKECVLSFAASVTNDDPAFTSEIRLDHVMCLGDRIQLREVLFNLFQNAREATSHTGSICIRAYRERDHVIISVSDTGCGISDEQLTHIYEPFVTYKGNGCGLGLSICRQIIDMHQGSLSVHSSVGEGTTFRITLPTENEGKQKTADQPA